jgi:hypothetical protein
VSRVIAENFGDTPTRRLLNANFRIAEGYASLSYLLARQLKIRVAEPVDRVTWKLVWCPINSLAFAVGHLADFQGANDEHI